MGTRINVLTCWNSAVVENRQPLETQGDSQYAIASESGEIGREGQLNQPSEGKDQLPLHP